MYLVPFTCPRCENSAKAPLAGVTDGDAGIWICDACGAAYQINIDFSCVGVPCSARDRNAAMSNRASECGGAAP
jgi:transcription elongation factor Elf1